MSRPNSLSVTSRDNQVVGYNTRTNQNDLLMEIASNFRVPGTGGCRVLETFPGFEVQSLSWMLLLKKWQLKLPCIAVLSPGIARWHVRSRANTFAMGKKSQADRLPQDDLLRPAKVWSLEHHGTTIGA